MAGDTLLTGAGRELGIGAWLLHNYLYIRIPLCSPQAFLQATLPFVSVTVQPLVLLSSLPGLARSVSIW